MVIFAFCDCEQLIYMFYMTVKKNFMSFHLRIIFGHMRDAQKTKDVNLVRETRQLPRSLRSLFSTMLIVVLNDHRYALLTMAEISKQYRVLYLFKCLP